MAHELELKISPEKAFDQTYIYAQCARVLHLSEGDIQAITFLKRSIDARKKPVIYILRVKVFLKGESIDPEEKGFVLTHQPLKKRIGVVGFGPAGMFAALQLLEMGYQPVVFERGKMVKDRRRDLAQLNKELLVNPESNYCFGEGGAGTYSDGKLYTRSKKRGDIRKVLKTFVDHGAHADIMVNAHPHIGTNKLPGIIENIRETLLAFGAEIRFNSRVSDFIIDNQTIKAVEINEKEHIPVDAVILATGHSARDIFELLVRKNIYTEAKPFALGVRIEHPQSLIDSIQYGVAERGEYLPPASYSLVTQAAGNGVFSFCMCPGGIIAPAATGPGEVVVNGWSPSKRNGKFANSGMVVTVNPEHWVQAYGTGPLAALEFQKRVEQKAFAVFNSIKAPAQRMDDFIQKKISAELPECSYLPGVGSADLHQILPKFIGHSLSEGMAHFGKSMRGYRSNDAILVGVESRTSSPVRIPRDRETLRHTEISNLFPCGEGAGYAGGIVSAALDGIACAQAVAGI
ncbi:MAG: NAD(P)/FAD-dependent oxidoreductase [Chitinophagaceae bacterium]